MNILLGFMEWDSWEMMIFLVFVNIAIWYGIYRGGGFGDRAAVARRPEDKGESMIEAVSEHGQVQFDGDVVRIARKGLRAFWWHGLKGEKWVPVSQLTTIQFKEANIWVHGYIQFGVMGGVESIGGARAATTDENSVIFRTDQADAFARLKDAVQARMHEIQAARSAPPAAPAASVDPLAQIQQLGALRDQGLITDEEFEAKKAQLLGL